MCVQGASLYITFIVELSTTPAPSLDQMLHVSRLYEVVDFIRTVPSYVSGLEDAAVMDEWYKEHITTAVNARSLWHQGNSDIVNGIIQN